MSDVSGIPNMGFGGGNFFAPQFSYNPQINPTAGYAAPAAYAQNVQDSTIRDLQYDQRLFQHYYEQSLGGVVNTTLPPAEEGHFTDYNAGGAYPSSGSGGGGLSSITSGDFGSPEWSFSNASDRPAYTAPWDYSGGSFNLPAYTGSAINWDNYQSPANNYNSFQGGWGNVSNDRNLGAGGTPEWSTLFPSGGSGSGFNWSTLFGGNGGGPRTDPAPNMAMPGGIGSPMTVPQQPAVPGSSMPYTSGIEPDQTGGRTIPDQTKSASLPDTVGPLSYDQMEQTYRDLATTQAEGSDLGKAPAAMPDPQKLLGYDPQKVPAVIDWSNFPSPANRYDTFQAPGGGHDPYDADKSADTLREEARRRLADLITGAPTKEAEATTEAVKDASVEPSMADFVSPANDYSKFQEPATYRTGYDADLDYLNKRGGHNSKMRPGGTGYSGIDESIHLTEPGGYKPLNPEFAARLRAAAEKYESTTGRRAYFSEFSRGSDVQSVYYQHHLEDPSYKAASPEGSRHKQGTAGDIPAGDFRDWLYKNGSMFGLTFPVAGDKPHIEMSPSYSGPNYAQPNPYPQGVPLPAERPAGAPERAFAPNTEAAPQPPMSIPVSEGTIPLPAARPAEAPGPTPLAPSGVQKAQAVLNSSVESLLTKYSPENLSKAGMFIDLKQPLREALNGPFGSQILEGLQPKLGTLGLTRDDFTKAVADPRARFGEGGGFGPYPDYTGPEAAPSGGNDVYSQFRQSANVEDRRNEQLSRDELATLQARGSSYIPEHKIIPSGQLSDALGLRDLPTPEAPIADSFSPQRLTAIGEVPLPQERPENLRHMDEANRELGMTPQEQALYERHLENLLGPGGVNNPPTEESPGGSRSTLYQANVEIDGKNYNIPTVYDGKIIDVDEAIQRAKAQGLEKFPSYPTAQAAEDRYMQMHDYMDRDVGDYFDKHGGSLFNEEGPPAPASAVSDGGYNFLDEAADKPDMRDFPSPANDYNTFQQQPFIPPWQAAIPQDKRDPGTIAAVEEGARRTGLAPEAIAAVITEESGWDPRNATGKFRGLTQMQEQTFKEAPGGRINGLTWDQYKNASGADQVKAYIDWLYQHNSLDRAANLGIDIRGKDPAEQAAWLQAFQFSPYGGLPEVKIPWVQEAIKGNYGMPVTNQPQAKDLGDWTLNAMRYHFGEEMMKNWPNTGRLPGGQ